MGRSLAGPRCRGPNDPPGLGWRKNPAEEVQAQWVGRSGNSVSVKYAKVTSGIRCVRGQNEASQWEALGDR